jgi:excinuclease ABC subunit B
MKKIFELHSPFSPAGDQPKAISSLVDGIHHGLQSQVLLGATGTGKTYTIAQVIGQSNKPTLVLSHNKTLAAQLYGELKRFFPNNAVEYFVSYYDYYQPEAYVPSTDNYIPKDAQINEQIDKLRHAATYALLERNDVIIVSSISCIYGLGSKEVYDGMILQLEVDAEMDRDVIISKLVDMQYHNNNYDFFRGQFRVRGDCIEIYPAHEDEKAIRIEMFGDEIERLAFIDPLRGTTIEEIEKITVYPASHYVMKPDKLKEAVQKIQQDLATRLQQLADENKLVEMQRLEERTRYDLEMIRETGRCSGIENYSRYLSGRNTGEPPPTLLEYFPEDWLMIIDESHVTVPQMRGMYKGDRSRKTTLVDYGFRLPSALDNRPLQFEEIYRLINQVIYVSATPSDFELQETGGDVVEQIIRPTGLLDPLIEVRPQKNQVDDLFDELKMIASRNQRALVTTLTKRMSQELTDYYDELGLRVRYLHSDIDTLERIEILRDLRLGTFDVLIGINLLREGLDIPEVALVAILDADKEGFLRNTTSLIQTIGRAARNVDGRCILYAEKITKSMKQAMEETQRRRKAQELFNTAHNITPKGILKEIENPLEGIVDGPKQSRVPIEHKNQASSNENTKTPAEELIEQLEISPSQIPKFIKMAKQKMNRHAKALEFEEAAKIRDQIKELETWLLRIS